MSRNEKIEVVRLAIEYAIAYAVKTERELNIGLITSLYHLFMQLLNE